MSSDVLTEVTARLTDSMLENFSAKLDTPTLQLRDGVEKAVREILANLASAAASPVGAIQVYESARHFDASSLANDAPSTFNDA